MENKIAHPYFLRTTADPDGKGYATLEEARLALDNLINRRSELAISVTEQGDGKWLIRQDPQNQPQNLDRRRERRNHSSQIAGFAKLA